MTTQAKQDLAVTFEDLGCRMTVASRRLVDVLAAKDHAFGAKKLLADVPGVGRATVYRTIVLTAIVLLIVAQEYATIGEP